MRSEFTLERPCVLCGSQKAYLFQKSDQVHRVVECSRCKLIYVDPLPTRTELEHHYDDETYYSEWISSQRVPRERLWHNRLDELLQ